MTGYRSKFLRHQCATSGCYTEGLPCWDDLIEQFPRNIRPMDVDGFVEIAGHFLFLEQKGQGAPLYQAGQGDALLMLSRIPDVTVVVFRPSATAELWDVAVWDIGIKVPFVSMTTTELHAWLRHWCIDAENTPAHLADTG